MMKAIIDIGSNSVRLAVFADGQIVFKGKITSQLGKGLALTGEIDAVQCEKTVCAVRTFVEKALTCGVKRENIHAFATATVRRAKNSRVFIDEVYDRSAVKIDVVSESEEAQLALKGCLGDKDGAVLDIGGASSELIVRRGGAVVYAYSLPLGAVVLTDMFGKDRLKMDGYVKNRVTEYGDVPKIDNLVVVGGTSSCCSRVLMRARREKKSGDGGYAITLKDLTPLMDKFFTVSAEKMERMGVEAQRTNVIAGGTLLLSNIIGYLGLSGFVASENDNLIGYYLLKCTEKKDEK